MSTTNPVETFCVAVPSHRKSKRLRDAIPTARCLYPVSLGSGTYLYEVPDSAENRTHVQRIGLTIRRKKTL